MPSRLWMKSSKSTRQKVAIGELSSLRHPETEDDGDVRVGHSG